MLAGLPPRQIFFRALRTTKPTMAAHSGRKLLRGPLFGIIGAYSPEAPRGPAQRSDKLRHYGRFLVREGL